MKKFCLNSQCFKNYLLKADEIKLNLNEDILDYVDVYPKKTQFVVNFEYSEENLEKMKKWKTLTQGRIILCLADLTNLGEIRKAEIPWYYDYPITTYFELNSLVSLGAESILVQSPLFNDLIFVSSVKVKIRLVPNVAYYATIPASTGVIGSWLRPEDLNSLGEYDIVYEFKNCENNPKREQALFDVYRQGEWKGDLFTIITNLNYHADNVYIPPELVKTRTTCGQRCQSGGKCRLCYRYLQLANKQIIEQIKNKG